MKLQVESKKCACDSYYAIDTEFKDTWTKYKSYDEIVNEVDILFQNIQIITKLIL